MRKSAKEEVSAKAVTSVVLGRAMVFPELLAKDIRGLRISPLGVAEEKEEL